MSANRILAISLLILFHAAFAHSQNVPPATQSALDPIRQAPVSAVVFKNLRRELFNHLKGIRIQPAVSLLSLAN